MKNIKSRRSVTSAGLLVLVIGLVAMPLRAQNAASPALQGDWPELIAQEGEWALVMTGEAVPSGLADIDFGALDRKEWKQLCTQITETVRMSEDAVWVKAVQDLIYLAVFFPEEVRFSGANLPLFYDYLQGRNEQHRIMALAALHAIGDYNTMANLSQRIRLERSPRVQRLAAAAVADYFDPSGDIVPRRRVVR